MKISRNVFRELKALQGSLAQKYEDAYLIINPFEKVLDDDADEHDIECYLQLLMEYNKKKEEYEACARIQEMLTTDSSEYGVTQLVFQ
jgi:hypothetical protein